jgi:hypothetical protein
MPGAFAWSSGNQKAILARRAYLCAGVNCMNANGSDDILLSDKKDISPIAALALRSAGVMAVLTESRLSDFTVMVKLTEGSSAVPYSLWGNARNDPAILTNVGSVLTVHDCNEKDFV